MPQTAFTTLHIVICLHVILSWSAPRAAAAGAATADRITPGAFRSAVLDAELAYLVYLPATYAASPTSRFPVVYLLHGRGDSMAAWRTIQPDLDRMIAAGEIPPLIAVMPDAPWTSRASYYIDSEFDGGRRVETACTTELIRHIDATYRTHAGRAGRIVAGYSMGGYGAMRWSLAHPGLFGGAIVLSPAVYFPLPPRESSTREFGAFGRGGERFDEDVYREKNYPALLPAFRAKGLPLTMFIAVGDDEQPLADPAEAAHDLDYEAHTLYNQVRRVPGITAQLRVLDGGHNWGVWRPALIEGLVFVFSRLGPARN